MKKQVGLAEIEAMEYGASFWVQKKRPVRASDGSKTRPDATRKAETESESDAAAVPKGEIATSIKDETIKPAKQRVRAGKKGAAGD